MKSVRQHADEGQFVYLDPFLIDRLRINLHMSRTQLVDAMRVAPNTIKGVFRGHPIRPDTAGRLAKQLGCQVTDLLAKEDPRYLPPTSVASPMSGASEWETESCLEQGRLASNGLYYIVCRMKHRFTAGRIGRGKFYHLGLMPPQIRSAMHDKLTRHADVCSRVGADPHVAFNLTSTPAVGDAGWWVIDDWVGGATLADRLEDGACPANNLPDLLLGVAHGLQSLHAAGVVFRELAPARVLIHERDGRAVLTDFELAKLLDSSPSVSSEWPEDPFRAPEVDGGNVTVRADLYSFGRLAVAATAGTLVNFDAVPEIFNKAEVPKRLAKLLVDCNEPVPSRRPAEVKLLVKELTRWAGKAG